MLRKNGTRPRCRAPLRTEERRAVTMHQWTAKHWIFASIVMILAVLTFLASWA